MPEQKYIRKIKSYVCRGGRLTPGQEKAYTILSDQYVLTPNHPFDFNTIFTNNKPVILEIGFGMGDSLLAQAKMDLAHNFLGIEVHKPGIGRVLNGIHTEQLANIRLVHEDAVVCLKQAILDQSLYGIQIFFPDPWHKTRHHKRRLIQPEFIDLLAKKLAPGGYLHCASDWQNYAEHMLDVITQNPHFQNTSKNQDYVDRPPTRPMTKFETRGLKLGHAIWDLYFIRR